MKNLVFWGSISLMLVAASVSVFSQNYEISVTINTRNDTIILGHYRASKESNSMRVSNTAVMENGKAVFRGDTKLPHGQYFLFINGRVLFDFIIGDNQQFSIVADTTDFINLTKFTSSPENDVFFEFKRDNINRQRQFQQLNEQLRNATSDDERIEIRTQIQNFLQERIKYIEELIDGNKNLFVSKFLRAIIPLETYMPEPPRDADGNITDPFFLQRWWRANFFSNLDIFDPDMLRTEFYERKLMDYITGVIPQHTDTINLEIDKILKRAQANDEIFRFIMTTILNHFGRKISDGIAWEGAVVPENVYVHIAEKWYIPYATWSTDEFMENLKKRVVDTKPNLIGNQAPPIPMLMVLPDDHFRAAALDTAIKYDVQAGSFINDFRIELLKSRFTVLYFWDVTCGHCRTSIQELFKIQEEIKDALHVITVQLYLGDERGRGKGRWVEFVNEQSLFGNGWYNAWSPFSNEFRNLYNISSVPIVYLLDERGNIIIRGTLSSEQIRDIVAGQTMAMRE